jgi:serine/threonine protein kinase
VSEFYVPTQRTAPKLILSGEDMPDKAIAPDSWPPEARELYSPVKPLGKGGFGAVWLAKSRSKDDMNQDNSSDNYVAIKLVGHAPKYAISSFERAGEAGYFHREVEVLKEISHPHIVKLIRVIEESKDEQANVPDASPYCMVLTYCRGPTLEQIIAHGGAPGIHMAREVGSQLVDAIAYLHTRAVLHRDIKPDNVIVSGAKFDDEACWSDDCDGEDGAKRNTWNIVLIDFGFARPLHPDDMKNTITNAHAIKDEPDAAYFGRSTIDGALKELQKKNSLDLSSSQSHMMIRSLSAVGNRAYAAPELLKGVRNFPMKNRKAQNLESSQNSDKIKKRKHEEPLSEYVSDYGMTADAFSLGCTLRYMLTGVPPGQSVDGFIAEKNNPLNIIGRKLRKKFGKDRHLIRKKKYRYTKELPIEASKVVLGLTHWNEVQRTTVRSARIFEWIAESYSLRDIPVKKGDLDYLRCALDRKI